MILEEALYHYHLFFDRSSRPFTKITLNDDPAEMHPLQAIGSVENPESLSQRIANMTEEEMLSRSEKYFNNRFVCTAFFYYFVGSLLSGKTVDDIEIEGLDKFCMPPSVIPYTVHKLHHIPEDNSSTAIFIDWDGTIDVGGGLRDNIGEFLQHYQALNTDPEHPKYRFIITSAGMGLMTKVGRRDPEILAPFDAVYEITGIARPGDKGKKAIVGKAYTDICRRLNIPEYRAVILTDDWADVSVENSYPLITIVTPEDLSAKAWISAISHFEGISETSFLRAHVEHKKFPDCFREAQDANGNTVEIRGYSIGNGLNLYRSTRLDTCYFLQDNTIKDLPQKLQSFLKSRFS